MAKPKISDYLKRKERLEWARFLNSPEGQKGLLYLKLAFPRKAASTDADLIRNSVGFEFWQSCIQEMEVLAELPESQDNPETHEPLER